MRRRRKYGCVRSQRHRSRSDHQPHAPAARAIAFDSYLTLILTHPPRRRGSRLCAASGPEAAHLPESAGMANRQGDVVGLVLAVQSARPRSRSLSRTSRATSVTDRSSVLIRRSIPVRACMDVASSRAWSIRASLPGQASGSRALTLAATTSAGALSSTATCSSAAIAAMTAASSRLVSVVAAIKRDDGRLGAESP